MLQALDEKLRLEIDGLREELAQFLHPHRLARLIEFGARIPRAIFLWARRTSGSLAPRPDDKIDEFRKTFLERAADAFRVPDEVTDAERGEVLACIPRGQAGQGPVALVLPDFLADAPRLGGREIDRAAVRQA